MIHYYEMIYFIGRGIFSIQISVELSILRKAKKITWKCQGNLIRHISNWLLNHDFEMES